MSDVVFQLTVRRDPNARRLLAQWERDLLASQNRVEQARYRIIQNSQQRIMALMQRNLQQQTAQANAEDARRYAQQFRLYQRHLQDVERAYRAAQQRMPTAPGTGAVPLGRSAAGGRAAAGGGGGIAAAAIGFAAKRFAPTALAYGAYRGITGAFSAASEREMMTARLGVLAGGKGGANKLLKGFQGLSIKSGVGVSQLADMATTMAGFGVPIDQINKRLEQLAAITAGDTQRMERLSLAFAQASGQGRLMAEELNQMIDAGFSPLIDISKATGLSIVELKDKMRDGELGLNYLTDALDRTTAAGGRFGGMYDAMAGTVRQSTNSLSAAWTELKVAFGGALADTGIVQKVSEDLSTDFSIAATGLNMLRGGEHRETAIANRTMAAMSRAAQLQAQGYKSTDTARSAVELAGSPWLMMQGTHGRYISPTQQAELKALELEQKLAELADKRAKKESDIANYRKMIAEHNEQWHRATIQRGATEMNTAKQINDIRLEGAKKELEARQDLLKLAQKTTEEAKQSLMSAEERFGAMSLSEQQKAIGVLQLARRGGVQNLSLDQISTLKSIGSKDAEALASAAYRHRASAAFGVNTGVESGVAARGAIAAQIRAAESELGALKLGADPSKSGVRYYENRQAMLRRRIAGLRADYNAASAQQVSQQEAAQVAMAERASVFRGERAAIAEARMSEQRISADVKQTIQFQANFENTAREIANQVQYLFAEAQGKQMTDIVRLIEPIIKQNNAQRMRNIAANRPNGGF